MQNIIIFMLSVIMLSIVMIRVTMLSVILLLVNAEYRRTKCHYAKCHYGDCRGPSAPGSYKYASLLRNRKFTKEKKFYIVDSRFSMTSLISKISGEIVIA